MPRRGSRPEGRVTRRAFRPRGGRAAFRVKSAWDLECVFRNAGHSGAVVSGPCLPGTGQPREPEALDKCVIGPAVVVLECKMRVAPWRVVRLTQARGRDGRPGPRSRGAAALQPENAGG